MKSVCESLSTAIGSTQTLPPWQLFDIIGGIGTGGWLAILLGRYRLDLEDCFSVYTRIADAIDPTKDAGSSYQSRGLPAVIDQQELITAVERAIDEHGIGQCMVDKYVAADIEASEKQCYAFAVGVVKRGSSDEQQQYCLFRAYQNQGIQDTPDLNPNELKVSEVCAATAAAKDLMRPYRIRNTVYWDDDFPNTHNVSALALDEAEKLCEARSPETAPALVLNISPGLPTGRDVSVLRQCAWRNASVSHKAHYYLRRVLTWNGVPASTTEQEPELQPRSQSMSMLDKLAPRTVTRSDTADSKNSQQSEKEHQRIIHARLRTKYDDEDIYHRLELPSEAQESRPYLNDVARPNQAIKLAQEYLMLPSTVQTINSLVSRVAGGSYRVRDITPETDPRSASPELITGSCKSDAVSSDADFGSQGQSINVDIQSEDGKHSQRLKFTIREDTDILSQFS